jgi:hypothetical protein
MRKHDRGTDRVGTCASGHAAPIGAPARIRHRPRPPHAGCHGAGAGRHGTVDDIRRKLADGSLVPDPARIARALLTRGLI